MKTLPPLLMPSPSNALKIIALVALLFVGAQKVDGQLRYRVTSLGARTANGFAPGGGVQNVFGSMANQSNRLAGGLPQGGTARAAVYQAGSTSIIPGLENAEGSVASGVNNAGQVVGLFQEQSAQGGLTAHGFYWNGTTLIDFNDLLLTVPAPSASQRNFSKQPR